MNDEYLWNKTGEDAGIEKLENALKAFRYQETAPPALPAKVLQFEEKMPRRRWFSFAFAFASSAAVILLAFILFFNFSTKQIEEAQTVSEVSTPQTEEKIFAENPVQMPPVLSERKIETPLQIVQPKIVKTRQVVHSAQVSTKTTARKAESKKPAVKLTDEERYAYDQLMLALSITGSKLKIVQDKIQNIEEQSVSKSGR